MFDTTSIPEMNADNALVVAAVAGVAVVLIGSAIRMVFRVALVAALVLGGWMWSEDSEKLTSDAKTATQAAISQGIETLPADSQGPAREMLSEARSTASQWFSDENVNSVISRLSGGLEGLQEVVDGYESDKGILPTEITPIGGE